MPDLIDRLYRIGKLQQIDCRHGNYELAPRMAKFRVSHVLDKENRRRERGIIQKVSERQSNKEKDINIHRWSSHYPKHSQNG